MKPCFGTQPGMQIGTDPCASAPLDARSKRRFGLPLPSQEYVTLNSNVHETTSARRQVVPQIDPLELPEGR